MSATISDRRGADIQKPWSVRDYSRLLAYAIAAQVGLGPLDYTVWEQNKEGYFAAIQAGLDRDYQPMAEWVRRALDA